MVGELAVLKVDHPGQDTVKKKANRKTNLMGISPCVTGPVERYEVGNNKELTKSPLPYIYTWWEFAPEDSRAENPVTTVTVFDSFSLFTAENNLARGVGLEKVTPVIFSGCGVVFSEAPVPSRSGQGHKVLDQGEVEHVCSPI